MFGRKLCNKNKPQPAEGNSKQIPFLCLECGEEFTAVYKGVGIGYLTVFYEPRPCPKCQSLKTKPRYADERHYKPQGVKLD